MKKIVAGALCAVVLTACEKKPAPAPPAAPPAPVSGIDLQYLDPAVKPQDDFFRYVNGKWLASAEIPADKSAYRVFEILDDQAELQLKAIIQEAAAEPNKPAGSDAQKVGDMYAAFMNEARIEQLGLKPLQGELARIDALASKDELPALLAHLARIGSRSPLEAYVDQDAKHSTEYTVYLWQRGMLGLPDRDYYLDSSAKFREIRKAYVAHLENMLALAGDGQAAANAKAVLAMETRLARAHWTRVEARDREKTYNKYEIALLNKLTPGFDFAAYVQALGVSAIPAVIVREPSAFQGLADQFKLQPLPTIKAYLKWQLLNSFAPYLPKAFVDENFAFYGRTLRGVQELRPRWKRGVEAVEKTLGEVLGRIYVARHFSADAKEHMDGLVQNLIKAYGDSIRSLDWMSEETKHKALDKLAKFTPKIGYPNQWKDYSALSIAADDPIGNIMRSAQVEHARELAKLGKPVDREEWFMFPQTVNAYYNPNMNEIVFPAAILQAPFFNLAADDAVNYGSIGAVIGHEIGHGFDDQGSKSDGDGNLKSWWTAQDRRKFEQRTRQLIEQYNRYEPLKGYKVNGALTVGENIGDLGGLSIAYKAYQLALAGKPAPIIDGLTGEQRFFMGWAQAWRGKFREEAQIERLKADPHAPPEFRCNGVLVNIPEFYEAFDIQEGDQMYHPEKKRVKIW